MEKRLLSCEGVYYVDNCAFHLLCHSGYIINVPFACLEMIAAVGDPSFPFIDRGAQSLVGAPRNHRSQRVNGQTRCRLSLSRTRNETDGEWTVENGPSDPNRNRKWNQSLLPEDGTEFESTWRLDRTDRAPATHSSASWQVWSSEEINAAIGRSERVRWNALPSPCHFHARGLLY